MTGTTLTLEDAVAGAATGDLWLFRGRSFADVAIRTLTNAPVNHVGMVVAIDDLPPLLWHAELGMSLPDVWTGEHQRGVQLHRLADAVAHVGGAVRPARLGASARGDDHRARHEDELMQVIARYDGSPFPRTLGLARSWVTGRVRRTRGRRKETLYCAELVAITYQAMGILPGRRPASWYDPGGSRAVDRIDLAPPFALTGEIAVVD